MSKEETDNQGKEKYSIGQIVLENIIIAINVAVGVWAMWDVMLFQIPIVSLLYFVFVTYMLVIFLRKHLCTHCYYYGKACHCGWGKIALMFKQNSGDIKKAKSVVGATWGVLMGLPIIITIIQLIVNYNSLRIIHLGALVLLLIIQTIVHKKDCATCKMKHTCPGAM